MPKLSHQLGQKNTETHRSIGLISALSIVTGSMLGVGIFLAPVTMSLHLNSTSLFLGMWVFTGIIVLSGATAYGELGVMFPQSGGDYIFHREALGQSAAFAYGWGLLSAGFAGSIAAMAIPLCTYQLSELSGFDTTELLIDFSFFKLQWAQLLAIGVIILLTTINFLGVWLSKLLQIFTAFIPIILLSSMSIVILLSNELTFAQPQSNSTLPSWTFSGLSDAYLQAYFAYAGWNAIIYTAGEVKKPSKTIPFALIGGTLLVITLYLGLCGSALLTLKLDGLRMLAAQRGDIGTAMAKFLAESGYFGIWISQDSAIYLITLLIAIALIASINATVLGGSRIAVALAKDKCFWPAAAEVHTRYGTPMKALVVQALIAIFSVLIIPWHLIFSLVSLVMVVGGSLTILALFILRKKRPDQERSYKAFAYPIFPLLFIISSLFVVIIKIRDAIFGQTEALQSLLGLFAVCLIFSFHLLWQKLKQPRID